MKKEYTTPSIQSLGTVAELTANVPNPNGCEPEGTGQGQLKEFTHTDGYENAQTGCPVS